MSNTPASMKNKPHKDSEITPASMKNKLHNSDSEIIIRKVTKHWSFRKPRIRKSEPIKIPTAAEWGSYEW